MLDYKYFLIYYIFNIIIKIKNLREGGSLYHYAHFICDCLFPEIIYKIYNYKTVFRIKNLDQTLGNFNILYEEIMQNKNQEISEEDFNNNNLNIEIIKINRKNYYYKIYFNKFRDYIFNRYSINPLLYDINYPTVLLIKRGERKELIDDEELKKNNKNVTTGKERREIDNIDLVESFLNDKFINF